MNYIGSKQWIYDFTSDSIIVFAGMDNKVFSDIFAVVDADEQNNYKERLISIVQF